MAENRRSINGFFKKSMPFIRIYEDSEITERVMLKGKEESGRGR